jgi:hypothetical protein
MSRFTPNRIPWFLGSVAMTALLLGVSAHAEKPPQGKDGERAAVPKAWDEDALATMEVPLADPKFSAKHVPAKYYYDIPVRPIYKSYTIYHPKHEPPGYLDWLKKQEPEVVWGKGKSPPLKNEADWIKEGENVFDAALGYDDTPFSAIILFSEARDPAWYDKIKVPLAKDGKQEGIMPFARYVIREKGKVEIGNLSCAMCHTRVMPDGSMIKGAQGNFPFDRQLALLNRAGRNGPVEQVRTIRKLLYGMPWLESDLHTRVETMSLEEIASAHDTIPPGVLARHGTSPRLPVQVPDLRGIKDRKYLDRTGLVRHRSIGDLMRYASLNNLVDLLSQHGDFIPGGEDFKKRPDPKAPSIGGRYSDEQLFALAKYLYSLEPPKNPDLPPAELVARGEGVFTRLRCSRCHSGESYTNNRLTPVDTFPVSAEHLKNDDILEESVGTDPTLALQTRRGTGYYKVPSLRGVWYRGPFEHNGSVATLEDWFDPRRLKDDYPPTGWKGPPGTKTRAVKGHRFGLNLPPDDRKALIAFLRTL